MTREEVLNFIKENAVEFVAGEHRRFYLNMTGKTITLCENGTETQIKSAVNGVPVQKKFKWGNKEMKNLTPSKVLLYTQKCEEVFEADEEIKEIIDALQDVIPKMKDEFYVLGTPMMLEAFGGILAVPRKDTSGDSKSRRYLANEMRVE